MKHIIFINGPGGSGKDTVASIIRQVIIGPKDSKAMKFAEPIKQGIPAIFGLKPEVWDFLDSYQVKEEPSNYTLGKTPREVQIALSEQYMKPLFGESVFGDIALQKIKGSPEEVILISDSGFLEEALPIISHYGKDNCSLLKIYRDGHSFEGDSRDYIDLTEVPTAWIENNGTIADLTKALQVLFSS